LLNDRSGPNATVAKRSLQLDSRQFFVCTESGFGLCPGIHLKQIGVL
jgi:hypothetical protein